VDDGSFDSSDRLHVCLLCGFGVGMGSAGDNRECRVADYLPGEQKVAANGLSLKVNLDGYFIDSIGYNLDFGGRLDMLS